MAYIDARAAMIQLRALATVDDYDDAAELVRLLDRAASPITDEIVAERLKTDAHMAFLCLHVLPPAGISADTLAAELDDALSAIEAAWAI